MISPFQGPFNPLQGLWIDSHLEQFILPLLYFLSDLAEELVKSEIDVYDYHVRIIFETSLSCYTDPVSVILSGEM